MLCIRGGFVNRIEKDAMGEVELPVNSYHGAFTQMAKINFQISGIKAHRDFLSHWQQ